MAEYSQQQFFPAQPDVLDYDYNPLQWNYSNVGRNILRYFLQGLSVAFAAYVISRGNLGIREIVMLGIVAAIVFWLLDQFVPVAGIAAKFGTGFALGEAILSQAPLAAAVL